MTTPRTRLFAGLLLALLLLLLAVRLTSMETLRETIGQKSARLAPPPPTTPPSSPTPTAAAAGPRDLLPITGPSIIIAESGITFLLAALAAALTIFTTGLSRTRLAQFLLITAILLCCTLSTLHAANRFNALTGLADLAQALIAGWTLALLCSLLGDTGRRAVIASLLAILALWLAKAYLQKFIEFPDLAKVFYQDPDLYLRGQGISPTDTVQVKLFESRLDSAEVTSYLSLSNVFATGLIGLLSLLTALITAQLLAWLNPSPTIEKPPSSPRTKPPTTSPEIRADTLCFILTLLLWVAGLFILPMTRSKGGTGLGFAAVIAIALGGFCCRWILAHRRTLITTSLIVLALAATAALAYGIHTDSLPSKSLLFRWHYWTASVPIIEQHPTWGVGLNNFGDYYLQFKRPSAPEDVKDPHNFFVRLAAETGLPATLLITLLLLWMIFRSLAPAALKPSGIEPTGDHHPSAIPITLATVAAILWIIIHLTISELPIIFNLDITLIFAILATLVFAIILTLLNSLDAATRTPALRYLAVAAVVGALAMFLYDQINMALVTGPVAMLFWGLLGLGDSYDAPLSGPRPGNRALALIPASLCTAAAIVQLVAMPLTILKTWDPALYETAYLHAYFEGKYDQALAALDAAIALSPNNIELHTQRIGLLRAQFPNQPLAPEIRRTLTLDKANANIRVSLALPDSDLPPTERAAILQQALTLDLQLPPDEYKRLTPEKRAEIEQKISQLQANNVIPPGRVSAQP